MKQQGDRLFGRHQMTSFCRKMTNNSTGKYISYLEGSGGHGIQITKWILDLAGKGSAFYNDLPFDTFIDQLQS
jgi:hypothetical protein